MERENNRTEDLGYFTSEVKNGMYPPILCPFLME